MTSELSLLPPPPLLGAVLMHCACACCRCPMPAASARPQTARAPTITLHTRRLVSEVKRLKGALRGAGPGAPPDPAAAEQLAALLRGLGACVSLLHERRHEQLLKDLLDTPLWQVPQVGAGGGLAAGALLRLPGRSCNGGACCRLLGTPCPTRACGSCSGKPRGPALTFLPLQQSTQQPTAGAAAGGAGLGGAPGGGQRLPGAVLPAYARLLAAAAPWAAAARPQPGRGLGAQPGPGSGAGRGAGGHAQGAPLLAVRRGGHSCAEVGGRGRWGAASGTAGRQAARPMRQGVRANPSLQPIRLPNSSAGQLAVLRHSCAGRKPCAGQLQARQLVRCRGCTGQLVQQQGAAGVALPRGVGQPLGRCCRPPKAPRAKQARKPCFSCRARPLFAVTSPQKAEPILCASCCAWSHRAWAHLCTACGTRQACSR